MELRLYVERWDKTVNDGREEVKITEEPVLQYFYISPYVGGESEWRDVPTVYSDE